MKHCQGLLLLIGLSVCSGCSSGPENKTTQPDPLLGDDSLVEGSASSELPPSRSDRFPESPTRPPGAWAVAPPKNRPLARLGEPSFDLTTSRKPSIQQVGHDPDSPFGHHPEHEWLQGIIEKPSEDRVRLRYSADCDADVWGGVVCLEDHPRIRSLRHGDKLYVEGNLLREGAQVLFGQWSPYPRYRVERVLPLPAPVEE